MSKLADSVHHTSRLTGFVLVLATAVLCSTAQAQDQYYWGADTLADQIDEGWSYCSDGIYRPSCPDGYTPLDFYIGKLGAGWCTLEEWWQLGAATCGTSQGLEVDRDCDLFGPGPTSCDPRGDTPATDDTRYAYWYLRGPGHCPADPIPIAFTTRGPADVAKCEETIRQSMGSADLTDQSTFGCLQSIAFLETYVDEARLVPDAGPDYVANFDVEFAGNTLFVDVEESSAGCNWNRTVQEHRDVVAGFLHGLKAGISERGLPKKIGVYTGTFAWQQIVGADFSDLPASGIVVWQARYPLGDKPALDDVRGYADNVFHDATGLYSIGSWLPVIWQFDDTPDFNVTIQDPSRPFAPRSNGHTPGIQIDAASDDAGSEPANCQYSTLWNEIYFGECSSGEDITSGFRFPDVPVARGEAITSAYIEFTVDGRYVNPLSVDLFGEDAGNAQPFTDTDRPENRPLTAASATWNIPASDDWDLGETRHSPDLTAIVQEIVNRLDWNSYNALVIIVKNAGPANSLHRRVIGHERPDWFPGSEYAARLVITHGGTTPPTPTATATSTPTPTPRPPTATPTPQPPTATPTPKPPPCLCAWLCIKSKSLHARDTTAGTASRLSPIFRGIRKSLDTTSLLLDLRDDWMAGTPEGQRYIQLYEFFSPEIATILLADPVLRQLGIATVERFAPAIEALLSGAGAGVAISAEDMAAVDALLAALSEAASSPLADVVRLERERRPLESYVGLTADQAWDHVNGYDLTWLPPLGGEHPYRVKHGRKVPIKFSLANIDGMPVLDPGVQLWLQTPTGSPILGPIGLADNPNNGLKYNGKGTYHHNLGTKALSPSVYTLVVDYNSSTGEPATFDLEVR